MGSLGQDFLISAAPKRLIICCDGTWQSSVSGIKNIPSNVTRLARAISRIGRDADGKVWQQIVHYDAGIGTGDIGKEEKDRQGGFGIGFVGNVIEAYNFIVLNYAPGDQIFCFGFSRGAYTARAVAGLVNDIGVISPRDLQDFPDLYQLYQQNTDSHGFRKSRHYREWVNGTLSDLDSPVDPVLTPQSPQYGKAFHADAPEASRVVQVVGVFDTVGSLGIPDLSWTKLHLTWLEKWLGIPSPGFHNVALSPYIRHAFHALALDEHRAPFSPTLWHFPSADLATKKPRKSHEELHNDWKRIKHDPASTQEQISDAWAELIDSEMYDELKDTEPDLLQVWFPGFHINCGGGSDDPLTERDGDFEQLALITFAWMCEQVSPYLQLDKNLLSLASNSVQDRYELIHAPLQPIPPAPAGKAIGGWLEKKTSGLLEKTGLKETTFKQASQEVQYGWATGPIIDSFSGSMALAGSTTRTPGRYDEDKSTGAKLGKTNEMIHPSVQYRKDKISSYRPEPLRGFSRRQAPGKGFEWSNGSITIPEYIIKPEDVFTRYIAEQDKLQPAGRAGDFIQGIDRALGAKTS